MGQFHFDPDSYLDLIRAEVPLYDELQEETARATEGVDAVAVLELGVGTGTTTRRLLERHPHARVVGIDASEAMLAYARRAFPTLELAVARLEEPLPPGPFDLALSCLVVHHLDAADKRDLFRRVAAVLRRGGRFVLADVVVPDDPRDAVTPLTPGFDLPDRVDDQLRWLEEAGFRAAATWVAGDLAVLVGDLSGAVDENPPSREEAATDA